MTMTDTAAEAGTAPPAEDAERAAYTAGLRQIADWIDAHPEVKLPYVGLTYPFNWIFSGDGARQQMAVAARAFPGRLTKRAGGSKGDIFILHGMAAGVAVQFQADRDLVCSITGYEDREVDEVVTPAVTEKVTRPVPVWDCGPLLAPAAPGSEPVA